MTPPKLLILSASFAALAAAQLRIDCGSAFQTIDANGVALPDMFFSGGSTATSNTAPRTQLKTVRFGNFTYSIPTAAGNYIVVLHLFDAYSTTPGQRTMDVSINGSTVLSSFDAFGGKEIIKSFPVTVVDQITIAFQTVIRNAMVAAIEILPVLAPPLAALYSCSGEGADWSCAGLYRFDFRGQSYYGVPLDGTMNTNVSWSQIQ